MVCQIHKTFPRCARYTKLFFHGVPDTPTSGGRGLCVLSQGGVLKSGSTGPPGGPGPWRCVSASRGGTTHHGCGCMRAWECAGGGRESGSLSCWSMLEVSAGGRAADRGRGVLQCGLEVRAGQEAWKRREKGATSPGKRLKMKKKRQAITLNPWKTAENEEKRQAITLNPWKTAENEEKGRLLLSTPGKTAENEEKGRLLLSGIPDARKRERNFSKCPPWKAKKP